DPLVRMLPIEQPRAVNLSGGFHVQPTDEGERAKFLQMEATLSESKARWAKLPAHYWGVAGRAKPAATTLATYHDDARPRSDPKQAEEQAVIVRQNYGHGQVLFIGLDSTWRWRFKEGDTYHHRFWGQVVRWAGSDRLLVTGNDNLRFGTARAAYTHGEDVDVVVRFEEKGFRQLPASCEIVARMIRLGPNGEELAALVPLEGSGGRVLHGRVSTLPAGTYAVELEIADPNLAGKL